MSSSVSRGCPSGWPSSGDGRHLRRAHRAASLVELHAHRPRQRAAERVLAGLAVLEAHRQRAAERLALEHLQAFARGDAALGQVPEHLRVGVGHAHEHPALALSQGVERDRLALAQLQLGARDRVAVRVEASGRRASRRSTARAPLRSRARAPRPRRALCPRASRASPPGTARAAGGGGSPRARPRGPRRSGARRDTGWCSIRPSSPSFFSIAETDPGVISSRSASAFVETGSSSRDSSV